MPKKIRDGGGVGGFPSSVQRCAGRRFRGGIVVFGKLRGLAVALSGFRGTSE